MSLETMTRKEKNMLSSNVKEQQIPLKIFGNKARVLQMEMKLTSSTPIRNSETRNMVNESFQVESPIFPVNSTAISQINENKSKEIVPANANFSVKSNTLESKNENNPKNTPYHHMILYSSDDDDDAIVITRKKLRKTTTRKRRLVPFKEDTDSEISPKYAKNNVDFGENNHIDKVDNREQNNECEKVINTGESNTNKREANEIYYKKIEVSNKESNANNNINKKAKRKYTKETKTDEIETIFSEEVVDSPILETNEAKKMSPKNKLNKETMNKVLKAKNSVTKTDKSLQLNLSDNELDRFENKTKPKLESNKNVAAEIVSKGKHTGKQSQNERPKKGSKRKTTVNNGEQNLRANDNDEVQEISQGLSVRKSSRQRMVSQAYWIARPNSQLSDCADTNDLPVHTEDNHAKEQFSKITRPKPVSSKTKITKTKQQKQSKEIISNGFKESLFTNILMSTKTQTNKAELNNNNLNTNADNIHANGACNSDEQSANKATQNPNSDLDSCNVQTNTVHEKGTKSIPVKQNKKYMPSHSSALKKQKHSSFHVRKQPESDHLNTSPTDSDVHSDNIPSDTLISDFHEGNASKSANTNAEDRNKKSIIDNYSFKEIALAQSHLAEIENSKQPEYFGKFPQIYHTHSNNPNLSIGINISNPNFISGVLEIAPSGRKQQEYPKKNNMSFFILEGHAEVCVGNISKILRIGDSFFVPNNTPYYIVNLNKTKRLLILFTKHSAT